MHLMNMSKVGRNTMRKAFNELTLDELRSYKAVVEVYGTSEELYRVMSRINELEQGNK